MKKLSIIMKKYENEYDFYYVPTINGKEVMKYGDYVDIFYSKKSLTEKHPEFKDIEIENLYCFPELTSDIVNWLIRHNLNPNNHREFIKSMLENYWIADKILGRYTAQAEDLNYELNSSYLRLLIENIEDFYGRNNETMYFLNLEFGLLANSKIKEEDKEIKLDDVDEKWFSLFEGKVSRKAISEISYNIYQMINNENDWEFQEEWKEELENLNSPYLKDRESLIDYIGSWDSDARDALKGEISGLYFNSDVFSIKEQCRKTV